MRRSIRERHGRPWLTWDEWDFWLTLAERHGMFDIVADRRGGKMPAQIDPRHVAYGPVAIALARQFRRAFNARDAGDTAEQFHRDERVAQRARDERAFAAVVEDTQAAIERRALNSGGARRVRVPTVPA